MGLDFGDSTDYTASIVLDQQQQPGCRPTYTCVYASRFPLGTGYPAVIDALVEQFSDEAVRRCGYYLVADYTGCGRPVVQELRLEGLACTAITIHGGFSETRPDNEWGVAKRDLVGRVAYFLGKRLLGFAKDLPLLDTLQRELLNFRVRIDPRTAHESYSAWRDPDKTHDDLVIAVALALWLGERFHGQLITRVDLSRALMRTPRLSPGPGGSLRPRHDRLHLYDGVMDDTVHDVDWDEAKNRRSRGEGDDGLGPLRPERAP
jgi:hypothetical protein